MAARDLLVALIAEAIEKYLFPMTSRERREYADMVRDEAGEWLLSTETGPGTFLWTCRQAGYEDPAALLDETLERRAEIDYALAKRKHAAKR